MLPQNLRPSQKASSSPLSGSTTSAGIRYSAKPPCPATNGWLIHGPGGPASSAALAAARMAVAQAIMLVVDYAKGLSSPASSGSAASIIGLGTRCDSRSGRELAHDSLVRTQHKCVRSLPESQLSHFQQRRGGRCCGRRNRTRFPAALCSPERTTMMLCLAGVLAMPALAAAHGNMLYPPAWWDANGTSERRHNHRTLQPSVALDWLTRANPQTAGALT
jgi:hypothetical protein